MIPLIVVIVYDHDFPVPDAPPQFPEGNRRPGPQRL